MRVNLSIYLIILFVSYVNCNFKELITNVITYFGEEISEIKVKLLDVQLFQLLEKPILLNEVKLYDFKVKAEFKQENDRQKFFIELEAPKISLEFWNILYQEIKSQNIKVTFEMDKVFSQMIDILFSWDTINLGYGILNIVLPGIVEFVVLQKSFLEELLDIVKPKLLKEARTIYDQERPISFLLEQGKIVIDCSE